jgi:hypothetical protein
MSVEKLIKMAEEFEFRTDLPEDLDKPVEHVKETKRKSSHIGSTLKEIARAKEKLFPKWNPRDFTALVATIISNAKKFEDLVKK